MKIKAESGNASSAPRSGSKPWGIRVLAVIYGILAVVTGASGTVAALLWSETGSEPGPSGPMAISTLFFFSLLTGLASVGLWIHKPFGRMLALTTAWLVVLGSFPACGVSAWVCIWVFLVFREIDGEFWAIVAISGVAPLGAFILFSWFIAYLRQPHVRESFSK